MLKLRNELRHANGTWKAGVPPVGLGAELGLCHSSELLRLASITGSDSKTAVLAGDAQGDPEAIPAPF
ncbi:MAG TPA: hypothetical protein VFD85_15490 [Gemmatimonadales bacterium]|nr:hypothetical protein [Gemmatimonadales bacterium]